MASIRRGPTMGSLSRSCCGVWCGRGLCVGGVWVGVVVGPKKIRTVCITTSERWSTGSAASSTKPSPCSPIRVSRPGWWCGGGDGGVNVGARRSVRVMVSIERSRRTERTNHGPCACAKGAVMTRRRRRSRRGRRAAACSIGRRQQRRRWGSASAGSVRLGWTTRIHAFWCVSARIVGVFARTSKQSRARLSTSGEPTSDEPSQCRPRCDESLA